MKTFTLISPIDTNFGPEKFAVIRVNSRQLLGGFR